MTQAKQLRTRIVVQCDHEACRKEFVYSGSPAHYARSAHHYCSRKCQNTKHGLHNTPSYKIWERARKRALQKGWDFDLQISDIPPIPSKCPILGISMLGTPIVYNTTSGPADGSPSIDRLDPKRGYVVGNIRIISHRANRLRSDATAHELRLLAQDQSRVEIIVNQTDMVVGDDWKVNRA